MTEFKKEEKIEIYKKPEYDEETLLEFTGLKPEDIQKSKQEIDRITFSHLHTESRVDYLLEDKTLLLLNSATWDMMKNIFVQLYLEFENETNNLNHLQKYIKAVDYEQDILERRKRKEHDQYMVVIEDEVKKAEMGMNRYKKYMKYAKYTRYLDHINSNQRLVLSEGVGRSYHKLEKPDFSDFEK